MVTLQCRMDKEIVDILDEWCRENERTRTWIIRRALIFLFAKEYGIKKVKDIWEKIKTVPVK